MIVSERTFNEIVREYSQPLYFHIRRIVVSHEDAEDVLQETLVKAYRKIWMLRGRSSLRAWLYRIATNEAKRFLSKRYADAPLEAQLSEQLIASEYVDFTQEAELKLQKALVTLSPMQRAVFCLVYYEEMDYKEIARITGSTEGSVKVSYHYAKEKVKKFLEI